MRQQGVGGGGGVGRQHPTCCKNLCDSGMCHCGGGLRSSALIFVSENELRVAYSTLTGLAIYLQTEHQTARDEKRNLTSIHDARGRSGVAANDAGVLDARSAASLAEGRAAHAAALAAALRAAHSRCVESGKTVGARVARSGRDRRVVGGGCQTRNEEVSTDTTDKI